MIYLSYCMLYIVYSVLYNCFSFILCYVINAILFINYGYITLNMKGRVAIVTASSTGIGKGIVTKLGE
jgi:hypothetical protein